VDSSVNGGRGSDAFWWCTYYGGCSPDSPVEAGDGGPGLLGDAFASNSTFTGGPGGDYDENFYDGDCADSWGVDGDPGIAVDGTLTDLPATLTVIPAGIGDVCTAIGAPLQPNSLALFLVGGGVESPSAVGRLGSLFVELP